MNDENQQKAVYKDDSTQNMLNTPAKNPDGVGSDVMQFLKTLIEMIENGKIDLYKPDTLVNSDLYNKLPGEKQGEVDMEATNLLSAIREIKGLYDSGNKESFQIQNLVERLKNTKERLEKEGGNLFVI